jgi:hypothetical protein
LIKTLRPAGIGGAQCFAGRSCSGVSLAGIDLSLDGIAKFGSKNTTQHPE